MNMFASIAASGAAQNATSTPDSVAATAEPVSAKGQNNTQNSGAQFSIGIDLGTTHCALAFVN